jgi:Flp pilus assembly protein TadG
VSHMDRHIGAERSGPRRTTTASNAVGVGGRRGARDQGAATTELVIATPLLGLLLMLVVQFGVWAHAQHIAQAAANEALQVARAYQSSAAAGTAQGQAILDQTGGSVLTDRSVSVTRTPTTVTVTVTGHATSVVPGFSPTVRVTVSGPVERVTDG